LADNLIDNQQNGYTNYILAGNSKQTERLQAIFADQGKPVQFTPVEFALREGFTENDLQVCCYTDHQIFERYHRFKLVTRKPQKESITLKELNKLHQGDYVVHIDHGIGRFMGLVKAEINGTIQEAVRLTYRDNDVLLVSIHNLHRISKYKGKDGAEPNISKLGSGAWQKLKERTKTKVKDIAKDLIACIHPQQNTVLRVSPSPDLQTTGSSFIYKIPRPVKTTIAVKEDRKA
jgi:transcription-repair coupling factor (superfamily II helicase)